MTDDELRKAEISTVAGELHYQFPRGIDPVAYSDAARHVLDVVLPDHDRQLLEPWRNALDKLRRSLNLPCECSPMDPESSCPWHGDGDPENVVGAAIERAVALAAPVEKTLMNVTPEQRAIHSKYAATVEVPDPVEQDRDRTHYMGDVCDPPHAVVQQETDPLLREQDAIRAERWSAQQETDQ